MYCFDTEESSHTVAPKKQRQQQHSAEQQRFIQQMNAQMNAGGLQPQYGTDPPLTAPPPARLPEVSLRDIRLSIDGQVQLPPEPPEPVKEPPQPPWGYDVERVREEIQRAAIRQEREQDTIRAEQARQEREERFSDKLYKVKLGLTILIPVGGIAFGVWVWMH